MTSGATFSDCKRFRYTLTREWDGSLSNVAFIGLNPSTADETQDDPTIRQIAQLARHHGITIQYRRSEEGLLIKKVGMR